MTDSKPASNWMRFFDHHAPNYMSNVFTRGTPAEVEFLIAELGVTPPARILDMGCGTGRHSVELARRGFAMTGVDLSAGMLSQAREAARQAGVELELIQADATRVKLEPVFDGGYCVCEGAFGLLGQEDDPEEHDAAILANMAAGLKPGAGLVLTVLNGLKMIRQYSDDDVRKGRFDPIHCCEHGSMVLDGTEESVATREKGYVPMELKALVGQAGFSVEHIGGGTAGRWGRRQLELDEYEIMVIARRRQAEVSLSAGIDI